jgi:hypothetical protein
MASVSNPDRCLKGRGLLDSDYVSDIASDVAVHRSPTFHRHTAVEEGLDFILTHFKEGFPRTISTKTTEGRQVVVYNKDEALAMFKAANYLDCKIMHIQSMSSGRE